MVMLLQMMIRVMDEDFDDGGGDVDGNARKPCLPCPVSLNQSYARKDNSFKTVR